MVLAHTCPSHRQQWSCVQAEVRGTRGVDVCVEEGDSDGFPISPKEEE